MSQPTECPAIQPVCPLFNHQVSLGLHPALHHVHPKLHKLCKRGHDLSQSIGYIVVFVLQDATSAQLSLHPCVARTAAPTATTVKRPAEARPQWPMRAAAREIKAAKPPQASQAWTGAWRVAQHLTSLCVVLTASGTRVHVQHTATRWTSPTQETATLVRSCLLVLFPVHAVQITVHTTASCTIRWIYSAWCRKLVRFNQTSLTVRATQLVAPSLRSNYVALASLCLLSVLTCPHRVLRLPPHLVPLLRQQPPVRPSHLCQLLLCQVQQRAHHQVRAACGSVSGQVWQV